MPVLATWSPADAALDILAPLGLAVAAGTALVIDTDPLGPRVGDGPTLKDLVELGPTKDQLDPHRAGPAVLWNGGIEVSEAAEVLSALAGRWPAVVLRCPPRMDRPNGAVTFLPLLPEPYALQGAGVVVYQRSGHAPRVKPSGLVLPRPRRSTLESLFAGRRPPVKDRWIRGLRTVWESA